VALRLSNRAQSAFFSEPSVSVEVRDAGGAELAAFGGEALGGVSAVCPDENRVYIASVGDNELKYVRF